MNHGHGMSARRKRLLRFAFVALCTFVPGCGGENSAPETRPKAPTPKLTLGIEAFDGEPRRVAVVVKADDPAVWSALAGETDDRRYRQLLSLRIAMEEEDSGGTDGIEDTAPAILGRYEVSAEELRFTPAFPLLPGRTYVATFEPSALGEGAGRAGETLRQEYAVPASGRVSQPQVLAIYPSGSVVPANHLKFYVLFSEPMQQGDIFDFFRLQNVTTGEEIAAPFRETELWSEDGLQLTLWFHPGRQKEGVNLNVEIGPVLEEGDEYRLVIDGRWQSQQGVALGRDATKQVLAGERDRRQPSLDGWRLTLPAAGTRDSLQCDLPEPLDWALLNGDVWVETEGGEMLAGTVSVDEQETRWIFTPDGPWKEGVYRLAAAGVLEDLAGNSLERPFEVDVTEESSRAADSSPGTFYRRFEIRAGDSPSRGALPRR